MAKEWAESFYNSKAWIKCRNSFMESKYYVCEICNGIATICHHKEHLTPENINDPNVTLNWDNLQAVCHECHNKIHGNTNITREGLIFNDKGELIQAPQK